MNAYLVLGSGSGQYALSLPLVQAEEEQTHRPPSPVITALLLLVPSTMLCFHPMGAMLFVFDP